jgi:hypothetical protein
MLYSGVGVLLLVLEKSSYNLLIGILVLSASRGRGHRGDPSGSSCSDNLSELQADFVSKGLARAPHAALTSIRMFAEAAGAPPAATRSAKIAASRRR